MKTALRPEDIFYNRIYRLIDNLLIKNKNYDNSFYRGNSMYPTTSLLEDTKERAKYILEEMENMKHLLEDVE